MTDHLSTIRQTLLGGCGPIKNALAACDALEAERLKGCGFGCGPTGPEYVTPGFGIVPICPVHGWVCELLDRLEAERLTPEEARLTLAMFNTLAATHTLKGGYATARAKLERIAGAKPTSIRAMIDGET